MENKYYAKLKNEDVVVNFSQDEITAQIHGLDKILDYEPIYYDGTWYTQAGFEKIQQTQKYKDDQERSKEIEFECKIKQLEEKSTYIEYKNKKISLEEILFKSTIYN